MILENEFPQYREIAETVSKSLFCVNLIIKRGRPNTVPHNEKGVIVMPENIDAERFAGYLVHEAGHSVHDPKTMLNYLKCLNEVKRQTSIPKSLLFDVGNVISDLITDFENSKISTAKDFLRKSILLDFPVYYPKANKLQKLLWEFYDTVLNLSLPIKKQFEPKIIQIIDVLKNEMDRVQKYVKIARILQDLLDEDGDQGSGQGRGQEQDGQGNSQGSGSGQQQNQEQDGQGSDRTTIFDNMPIDISEDDIDDLVNEIFENADDVNEAGELIETLEDLLERGKGKGFVNKISRKLPQTRIELLIRFYEAKARIVRRFIQYPKQPRYFGSKVGTEKWKFKHGLLKIDPKKTIFKNGINIPLVTSRTSRILKLKAPEKERPVPIDVIISIDVSGSTEKPKGTMEYVADYEVIMLFALIEEAKRTGQNMALTLWSDNITYTTLPRLYGGNDLDKLKKVPFTRAWTCGGTNIKEALEQAQKNKDKLFMVFTDGEVYYEHLIPVDNVVFFLIRPDNENYEAFVEVYGKHRVIRIDKLENIPKVTLDWFRKRFMR